jgi:hypothetical protein
MPMKNILSKRATLTAIMSATVFALYVQADTLQAPQPSERHRIIVLGAETMPELSAHLVDSEKKAQEQTATVEVKVAGIQLIDPAAAHDEPQRGQGHLHYQVDSGPLIATTTTKLSFHELSSGSHKITVMLVGNDHQALGPRETLTVTVPPADGDRAQR